MASPLPAALASTGLRLLTGVLELLLHLGLPEGNPLPGQHVAQARHTLLDQIAGLAMLYHEVNADLLLLAKLDLDFHLAKPHGVKLQLGLLQPLGQHHIDLLLQLGRHLLSLQSLRPEQGIAPLPLHSGTLALRPLGTLGQHTMLGTAVLHCALRRGLALHRRRLGLLTGS